MSAAESEPAEAVHPTDLTLFQQEILYAIPAIRGRSGQRINDKLTERYGEKVHHGRLYPNLDDLVEKSLVEKEEIDGRTNGYSLTNNGKRLLRQDAQRRVGIADTLNVRGEE